MDFDQVLPRWTPDPNALPEFLPRPGKDGKAVTPYEGYNGPRSVSAPDEDGFIVEHVVPFARYIRAVDPAGNVVPLIVSTNRVDYDDGTGFEGKQRQLKQRQGWLFIDDPPYGVDAETWHEKLEGIIEERRAKHAAIEAKQASTYKTSQQALADANSAMMEGLIRKLFKELRAVKAEASEESEE